jgi:transposase InsO family protein
VLRTDSGGEYVNNSLKYFLEVHGIKHQTAIPFTLEQNGVAKRANRSIVEKARSMILEAGCSKRLWAEACNTAVYLKNRSLHILQCLGRLRRRYGREPKWICHICVCLAAGHSCTFRKILVGRKAQGACHGRIL